MANDITLAPGEEIVWTGRPDPSLHFTRTDVFFIPFSFLWVGFAIFWTLSVSRSTAPPFVIVFGLFFVAFGVYISVGRFFVKAFTKRRTRYYLTTERAVVVGPRSTDSIALAPGMGRSKTVNRFRMDVSFDLPGDRPARMRTNSGLGVYANSGLEFFAALGPGLPVAFYDVRDVDGLEHALRHAFANTRGAAAGR
ncbi:hypothetical protein FHX49_000780 [Microbacterium endophyticum]|uniref:PH domain-containing protein n=1 Tax=Microbacterium endophyticum TaxID=1526412 RepID=A0A7W4V1X9_9MICO|nr:hypothetical protein [Microbacterium endophyticum]MBB2975239.1 hypothetical protein [Microbacterium endophyticum]NIK37549.1 hypothetical protein [Microbacterium endophyticum]